MMDLSELREKIDETDRQIVALYEERMALSAKVATYKMENNMKVLDSSREAEKIKSVKAMTSNSFNEHGIEELYEHIMAISRKKQYVLMRERGITGRLPFIMVDSLEKENVRVVFQGTSGSFSEEAMFRFFGKDVNSISVGTFKEAMSIIDEGLADYAVLPIENSSAGIVSQNYDLLVKFENYIVGELVIPVDHCLLGLPGSQIKDIKEVYSHPQALMQCAPFIEENGYFAKQFENTALAAKFILDKKDPTKAAIASKNCAELYGLDILKEGINFDPENSTRFIVVTNQKIFVKDASKVSVCFELPHHTGSLYHILSHFFYNDMNMNRIESRPISERPWEYRFFIDFEGNLSNSGVKNALHGLREETINMKILGNY